MVHVVASAQIVPGKREEFLEIFKALVPTVHEEAGCIEYFPSVDVESDLEIQNTQTDCVTILEKWESLEALKAHLAAPHMDKFREQVANLVSSLSIKILKSA